MSLTSKRHFNSFPKWLLDGCLVVAVVSKVAARSVVRQCVLFQVLRLLYYLVTLSDCSAVVCHVICGGFYGGDTRFVPSSL